MITATITAEGPIEETKELLGHTQELRYSVTVLSEDKSRQHTQKGADREACLWGIRESGFTITREPGDLENVCNVLMIQ